MRINLDEDVRNYMVRKHRDTITVKADRFCVETTCSDAIYPLVDMRKPKDPNPERYDQFSVDGLTIYFDRRLETPQEVTLKLDHRFLHNEIVVDGLPERPVTRRIDH